MSTDITSKNTSYEDDINAHPEYSLLENTLDPQEFADIHIKKHRDESIMMDLFNNEKTGGIPARGRRIKSGTIVPKGTNKYLEDARKVLKSSNANDPALVADKTSIGTIDKTKSIESDKKKPAYPGSEVSPHDGKVNEIRISKKVGDNSTSPSIFKSMTESLNASKSNSNNVAGMKSDAQPSAYLQFFSKMNKTNDDIYSDTLAEPASNEFDTNDSFLASTQTKENESVVDIDNDALSNNIEAQSYDPNDTFLVGSEDYVNDQEESSFLEDSFLQDDSTDVATPEEEMYVSPKHEDIFADTTGSIDVVDTETIVPYPGTSNPHTTINSEKLGENTEIDAIDNMEASIKDEKDMDTLENISSKIKFDEKDVKEHIQETEEEDIDEQVKKEGENCIGEKNEDEDDSGDNDRYSEEDESNDLDVEEENINDDGDGYITEEENENEEDIDGGYITEEDDASVEEDIKYSDDEEEDAIERLESYKSYENLNDNEDVLPESSNSYESYKSSENDDIGSQNNSIEDDYQSFENEVLSGQNSLSSINIKDHTPESDHPQDSIHSYDSPVDYDTSLDQNSVQIETIKNQSAASDHFSDTLGINIIRTDYDNEKQLDEKNYVDANQQPNDIPLFYDSGSSDGLNNSDTEQVYMPNFKEEADSDNQALSYDDSYNSKLSFILYSSGRPDESKHSSYSNHEEYLSNPDSPPSSICDPDEFKDDKPEQHDSFEEYLIQSYDENHHTVSPTQNYFGRKRSVDVEEKAATTTQEEHIQNVSKPVVKINYSKPSKNHKFRPEKFYDAPKNPSPQGYIPSYRKKERYRRKQSQMNNMDTNLREKQFVKKITQSKRSLSKETRNISSIDSDDFWNDSFNESSLTSFSKIKDNSLLVESASTIDIDRSFEKDTTPQRSPGSDTMNNDFDMESLSEPFFFKPLSTDTEQSENDNDSDTEFYKLFLTDKNTKTLEVSKARPDFKNMPPQTIAPVPPVADNPIFDLIEKEKVDETIARREKFEKTKCIYEIMQLIKKYKLEKVDLDKDESLEYLKSVRDMYKHQVEKDYFVNGRTKMLVKMALILTGVSEYMGIRIKNENDAQYQEKITEIVESYRPRLEQIYEDSKKTDVQLEVKGNKKKKSAYIKLAYDIIKDYLTTFGTEFSHANKKFLNIDRKSLLSIVGQNKTLMTLWDQLF